MKLAGAIGGCALCILSLGWSGCGYSDFRLPELAPAEPHVRYQWEPRDIPVLPHGGPGDWDSHDALNPSVVHHGAAYFNFYESGVKQPIIQKGEQLYPAESIPIVNCADCYVRGDYDGDG